MKRVNRIVLFLITATILLNAVSAISTNIKEVYAPKETIISEISGSILEPINPSNLELRKNGRILTPLDYEIKRLGEQYYIWALAPEERANYTLIIKEIATYVSGNVQRINYEKNFSVSGDLTDYYIRPGFISTEKDFEIKAQLNVDTNKQIEIEFINKTSFMLRPGENVLKFSIQGINETGLFNISIGKYNVPAYIRVNKTIQTSPVSGNASALNLTNLTVILENISEAESEAIREKRLEYHCYEFPGKLCGASEVCSGKSITSLDGACCVNGDCVAAGEQKGSTAWIGYLIAALVIIIVAVVWIRYKKVKAEKNPLAKKISASEKRIP